MHIELGTKFWGQRVPSGSPRSPLGKSLGSTGLRSGTVWQWEPGMVPVDAALGVCLCPPIAEALKRNEMLPPPWAPCPHCHRQLLSDEEGVGGQASRQVGLAVGLSSLVSKPHSSTSSTTSGLSLASAGDVQGRSWRN